MGKLLRVLRTVKYLKPIQIWFQVWRRVQRKLGPHPACGKEELPEMTFLNLTARPQGWNDSSLDMLWRYNLHYFDGLEGWKVGGLEGEMVGESKPLNGQTSKPLIMRWIKENPKGSVPGWEPYPISLRVVNWVKWVGGLEGWRVGRLEGWRVEKSLSEQLEWLESHLEYHILANHYLANLKAMVIGNAALGRDYGKWMKLYVREIGEQVLADGGHYERSVMYHAIIFEDVLDVIKFGGESAAVLRPVAERMLRYLVAMTGPDGKIAMFNDAADGIAKPTAGLVEYAASLGISAADTDEEWCDFPETGYARWECGDFILFVDAAPIGPDYQPGHAHADTLTYELYWKGRKIVADAGTSEYRGKRRAFERSSRAHNVVVVDGCDSSEVWSSHRVGRRARIVLREKRDDSFVAAYEANGVRVERCWKLSERGLTVTDSVRGGSAAETLVHFAAGEESTLLFVPNDSVPSWETYERALEFGKVENASCVRIRFDPKQGCSYRLEVKG